MSLKKLPIGIQTFSKIRKNDFLYIDKTKIALKLIESHQYVFLSRPRRFGKSLFLDTLSEIFKGNKELFKDLHIYDKWDFNTKYPVIKIDFFGDLRSGESLKKRIFNVLRHNQENLNIECFDSNDFASCFEDLIKLTSKKYNQQVVVLIDEYDKAILDNLDQMEVAKENREIIKGLYTVLKGCDEYLKFVFLTGVSKFSKASIFSGLNMLEDISLNPNYGNVCGYTQKDIETTILPYLKGVDLDKLKAWYNGYNFLKDDVYNPFCMLLFIKNEYAYDNYWFESGTPSFLIKLIEKNNYFIPKLANLIIGKKLLNSFDIDSLDLEIILYQAGYLTIDKVLETPFGSIEYKLKLPNKEVQLSLNDTIISSLTDNNNPNTYKTPLYQALYNADLEALKSSIHSIFASIPYNNSEHIKIYEGYYASIIYTYLQSLGIDITGEDITNKGRIDLTAKINDIIYVIEFKVGNESAMKQIKQMKYYEKYLSLKQDVYLVGINFDEDDRNLSGFEWEKM